MGNPIGKSSEGLLSSDIVPSKVNVAYDCSASQISGSECNFVQTSNLWYSSADLLHSLCAVGAYSFAIFSGLLETRAANSQ